MELLTTAFYIVSIYYALNYITKKIVMAASKYHFMHSVHEYKISLDNFILFDYFTDNFVIPSKSLKHNEIKNNDNINYIQNYYNHLNNNYNDLFNKLKQSTNLNNIDNLLNIYICDNSKNYTIHDHIYLNKDMLNKSYLPYIYMYHISEALLNTYGRYIQTIMLDKMYNNLKYKDYLYPLYYHTNIIRHNVINADKLTIILMLDLGYTYKQIYQYMITMMYDYVKTDNPIYFINNITWDNRIFNFIINMNRIKNDI